MINNEFLSILKEDKEVFYIYQYGSSVYGVCSENSDIDFLVIVGENFIIPKEYIKYAYKIEHISEKTICHNLKYNNCDFIFYTINQWFEMINNNSIETWECSSLTGPKNRKYIHKEYVKVPIKLNQVALRKEISTICSNAFSKAKKEFKQNNYYIGKKSLWHTLRISLFGIQVVENHKIINYKEANKYYNDIVLNPCNDWNYYEDRYKPILHNLRSQFRHLTEGKWTQYCISKYKSNG